ncbi:ABC transporter permease [Capsulimonas corticalis]|uniref:ABC transporter permease n=1 Tax=Capsulimonas corticalis TaxID=2219043 RepID=A0A402CXG2_9BACT|nr:ABC-F family ATP-binding cassette domain-containing protein [Capsulimonas corticalis]BDI32327.1 ABC transporter permease [Capsulimonas corticalis]
MSFIRLNNVSVRYDERTVLREVFFRLQAGDRVGFIGKNGAGKTTLLKLILGQVELTEGKVEVDQNVRIGYFSQFSELDDETSVQEVLEGVFADIRTIEAEIDEIGIKLSDPDLDMDAMDPLLARQAHLLEEMERRDGWNYPTAINTVLSKLGFSDEHRHRPVQQLSGGWRNRASLAKILLEEPDVLLLDEPTNFLDLEGVTWLEGWLQKMRGAYLVVSHDRHFLDRVVNKIVEVENYHLHEYDGDYTTYIREKPFRLKTLQSQFQHEEEMLEIEAETIEARKQDAANPSQALRRRLADVKKRAEPRPADVIVTDIYDMLRVPEKLFSAEKISKAYGDQTLFTDMTFEMNKSERLAIIGANGSGKSTLLRLITGEEKPDEGRAAWASGVKFAYFNQVLAELPPNDTISHAVNVYEMANNARRKQVHRFLGLLQFSEMDMKQKISTLSGGQKARVALARCLLSGAAALVLDEPTNHLDVTSIQVLERALVHFPGATIVVSHDRFFIDAVATRLLVFEGGGVVKAVSGNWTTWHSRVEALGV